MTLRVILPITLPLLIFLLPLFSVILTLLLPLSMFITTFLHATIIKMLIYDYEYYHRIVMLKKKPVKKLDYRTQLRKIVRFQNQASCQFQITWVSPSKKPCKVIQNKHYCFCGHFLSQHLCSKGQTINKCTADGCKCQAFCFIPDLNLKCMCKHAPYRHEQGNKKCKQCASCIGFLTDWVCQCGYRFEEHSTDIKIQKENNPSIILNQRKSSEKAGNTSLPNIRNTLDVRYPNGDKVKESLSCSLVKLKVANSIVNQVNAESQHQSYLKQKLRQANLRYFSKFKQPKNQTEQIQQQAHQTNALDLYIQPHLFRNCSLTKHINILTANRR